MKYDTLSEAITDLQNKGYSEDLNLRNDCLECKALDYKIHADQFEVDEMHRFEGDSNPDDSSILFAISSKTFELKGLLVDAYGVYADPLNIEMIQKLKYRP
ncbi:phosphoribosylpyrophosphate synthetase [uncultured Aquimarina sp.]|uniref:phosphoribosylpyrophosphate synthetase n=1 Tax=uncultured Aquimarina sp. TaxID=575652 RepID=UPI00345882D8